MKKLNDTLDLHGVKHALVQKSVDSFIYGHQISNTQSIKIITGHSPKMKDLVNITLLDYGYTSEEDFLNKGQLNVKLY